MLALEGFYFIMASMLFASRVQAEAELQKWDHGNFVGNSHGENSRKLKVNFG